MRLGWLLRTACPRCPCTASRSWSLFSFCSPALVEYPSSFWRVAHAIFSISPAATLALWRPLWSCRQCPHFWWWAPPSLFGPAIFPLHASWRGIIIGWNRTLFRLSFSLWITMIDTRIGPPYLIMHQLQWAQHVFNFVLIWHEIYACYLNIISLLVQKGILSPSCPQPIFLIIKHSTISIDIRFFQLPANIFRATAFLFCWVKYNLRVKNINENTGKKIGALLPAIEQVEHQNEPEEIINPSAP